MTREAAGRRIEQLAAEIQRHVHENVLMLFTGQFSVPAAHRADIVDVLPVGYPVFWNMRRVSR